MQVARSQTPRGATLRALAGALGVAVLLISCGSGGRERSASRGPQAETTSGGSLKVYSGRQEELVGPMMEQFEKETGIEVAVKYGNTAELAATLLEEGDRSPADLFLAQDAGALGAVAKRGMFAQLPAAILERVPAPFRSPESEWVGITGRVRTVVFNTRTLKEADMPESVLGFTDRKWKDRLGWAPANGSFQAFVTALRKVKGERIAREWLAGVKANNPRTFPANAPIVQAVGRGEIDAGFVNHYYLVEMKKDDPQLEAQNYYFRNGDPGGLVNVSGAGILRTSNSKRTAERLISFFLSEEGQRHWAVKEFEYPLTGRVEAAEGLPPLRELHPPDISLSDLDDLEGTLQMLREAGVT